MSDLSREDVVHILDLIDQSPFDFFELQTGDLKLTVSKTGVGVERRQAAVATAAPAVVTTSAAPAAVAAPPVAAAATAAAPAALRSPAATQVSTDGLVPVPAPMVGTFYAQPEPGAPPYVQVGSAVTEETTLGLIEVMKVFTPVSAGIRGVVAEILVQNAQFVEFGQPLFLLRPDTSPDGEQS